MVSFSTGGVLPGMDQTANAAEAWALLQVLIAAVCAGVSVTVIIDNKNVVDAAYQALTGDPYAFSSAPLLWAKVTRLARHLPQANLLGCLPRAPP